MGEVKRDPVRTRDKPLFELSSIQKVRFQNRHGEDWEFSFNASTGMATVEGSDVDWRSYPVVEGTAVGLLMDSDETAWLRAVWTELCSAHPTGKLYEGKQTEFKQTKSHCFLTNSYCPTCLLQKREFEVHHCIAATDGGPDTLSNLLEVCSSCHAIITRGSVEDRVPKAGAAFNHQLMNFGIQLFQDAITFPNKRTGNWFVDSSRSAPKIAEAISKGSAEELTEIDVQIKREARVKYQYMRDLGLGKWSWQEYDERFLNPMKSLLEEQGLL